MGAAHGRHGSRGADLEAPARPRDGTHQVLDGATHQVHLHLVAAAQHRSLCLQQAHVTELAHQRLRTVLEFEPHGRLRAGTQCRAGLPGFTLDGGAAGAACIQHLHIAMQRGQPGPRSLQAQPGRGNAQDRAGRDLAVVADAVATGQGAGEAGAQQKALRDAPGVVAGLHRVGGLRLRGGTEAGHGQHGPRQEQAQTRQGGSDGHGGERAKHRRRAVNRRINLTPMPAGHL